MQSQEADVGLFGEERKQEPTQTVRFPPPNIIGNVEDQPDNGGFGAFQQSSFAQQQTFNF